MRSLRARALIFLLAVVAVVAFVAFVGFFPGIAVAVLTAAAVLGMGQRGSRASG
jgi:hypothetical protein